MLHDSTTHAHSHCQEEGICQSYLGQACELLFTHPLPHVWRKD